MIPHHKKQNGGDGSGEDKKKEQGCEEESEKIEEKRGIENKRRRKKRRNGRTGRYLYLHIHEILKLEWPLDHFKASVILILQISKLRHKYAKLHIQDKMLKVAKSDIKNSQIF